MARHRLTVADCSAGGHAVQALGLAHHFQPGKEAEARGRAGGEANAATRRGLARAAARAVRVPGVGEASPRVRAVCFCRRAGWSLEALAALFGISRVAVCKALKRFREG